MADFKTLVFSSLWPNSEQPGHGIFIEQRLRHLLATGRVEARVLAPVPWFPFGHRWFGRYAVHARVPRREERHGIEALHPRYPLIPKIGWTLTPHSLAIAMRPVLARMIRSGFDFDLLDAYYFFPDGVAAALLGRRFGKPVVISALGSDINLVPNNRRARRLIVEAARSAAAVTTVSQDLKEKLLAMGVGSDRVSVVRHGVDLELFRPIDRATARARLGLTGKALLSVGHLVRNKGHDIAVRALSIMPDVVLLIAGDGEEGQRLRDLAASLGVADRVRFLGRVDHHEMPTYFGAADALVLASSREGIANVLLESMACGTPVIATDVGGNSEVFDSPSCGVLLQERTPEALAAAAHGLLAAEPDRADTRRRAERHTWERTSVQHLAVLERALQRGPLS